MYMFVAGVPYDTVTQQITISVKGRGGGTVVHCAIEGIANANAKSQVHRVKGKIMDTRRTMYSLHAVYNALR